MSIWIRIYGAGRRFSVFSMVLGAIVAGSIHEPAEAHELRPTIVTAEISDGIDVRLSLNLEAQVAGIGPEHSNDRVRQGARV